MQISESRRSCDGTPALGGHGFETQMVYRTNCMFLLFGMHRIFWSTGVMARSTVIFSLCLSPYHNPNGYHPQQGPLIVATYPTFPLTFPLTFPQALTVWPSQSGDAGAELPPRDNHQEDYRIERPNPN